MFKWIKHKLTIQERNGIEAMKAENAELKQQIEEQAEALMELAEILTETEGE